MILVGITLAGIVAGALAARAARREVEPTVQAFSEFRAALEPAVVELSGATRGARRRLMELSERGRATSRR